MALLYAVVKFCVLMLHSEGVPEVHIVPYFLGHEQLNCYFSALSPGGQ